METGLAVASKRDVRHFDPRPVPAEVQERILDAGRLAGSAHNRQPWRLVVTEQAALRAGLATAVYAPAHVVGAPLAVTIAVTPGGAMTDFDAGRAAQNMMLVAWDEGVVSCPNGIHDRVRVAGLLGLTDEERPVVLLSFGYPIAPADPARRSAADWSRRAWRAPLEQLVRRLP